MAKTDASRTLIAWQNNAAQLLHEKGVDFSRPSLELGRRVEAMVVARAYAESQDKPKIALQYEYASSLFTDGKGPGTGKSVNSFLPPAFSINKTFIPFVDQSVMVLCLPTRETAMFAKFCSLMLKEPALAKRMSVHGEDVRMFQDIVDLVEEGSRIEAFSQEDMDGLLAHQAAGARVGRRAWVQVNLSLVKVPLDQAAQALRLFLDSPTDTVAASVRQLIQKEFAST